MKGVVFLGDRKLALMDFSDPAPGPDEVVLEIKSSGPSATPAGHDPQPAHPLQWQASNSGV